MRLLAIDTAGPVVGVALWVDGSVLQRTERIARGAETRLVPWCMELCAEAGLTLSALDGIAAAAGPGAFTGLRVGLATAGGLGLALDRPVWLGDALLSRALRVHAPPTPLLSWLDARKQRVYALALGAAGEVTSPAADVPPEAALDGVSGAFRATGEGALVYASLIEAAGGVVVCGADDPSVGTLAAMGVRGLDAGEGQAATALAPRYLRAPDAKVPASRRL